MGKNHVFFGFEMPGLIFEGTENGSFKTKPGIFKTGAFENPAFPRFYARFRVSNFRIVSM